jgi:hypothetical protein
MGLTTLVFCELGVLMGLTTPVLCGPLRPFAALCGPLRPFAIKQDQGIREAATLEKTGEICILARGKVLAVRVSGCFGASFSMKASRSQANRE